MKIMCDPELSTLNDVTYTKSDECHPTGWRQERNDCWIDSFMYVLSTYLPHLTRINETPLHNNLHALFLKYIESINLPRNPIAKPTQKQKLKLAITLALVHLLDMDHTWDDKNATRLTFDIQGNGQVEILMKGLRELFDIEYFQNELAAPTKKCVIYRANAHEKMHEMQKMPQMLKMPQMPDMPQVLKMPQLEGYICTACIVGKEAHYVAYVLCVETWYMYDNLRSAIVEQIPMIQKDDEFFAWFRSL